VQAKKMETYLSNGRRLYPEGESNVLCLLHANFVNLSLQAAPRTLSGMNHNQQTKSSVNGIVQVLHLGNLLKTVLSGASLTYMLWTTGVNRKLKGKMSPTILVQDCTQQQ
jgi:hypothetical protein